MWAVALSLLLSGCFFVPNAVPIPRLDVDRTRGVAPLTVTFDASRSYDPDGEIRRFRWDFGDGRTGDGSRIEHTYTSAGSFEVTLTVTDGRGGRADATARIDVRAANELPVAAFSVAPTSAFPQQVVRFDAAASYDPDGDVVAYAWEFGDGATASGVRTTHAYAQVGTYRVILTIQDDEGDERTAAVDVRVSTQIDASRTLSRHYEWEYQGQAESCDLEIPEDLYIYYRSQPRMAWAARDYDEYVLDPLDDPYLEEVAQEILGGSDDVHEALENALFFVQKCMRYVYDPRWMEYPRYPVEMLVEGGGDCEDTAILYTSLVRTLGQGALMVAVDTDGNGYADHMIAWVPVAQSFVAAHPDRSFWQYEGKTYAFAETAVEGGYLALGVDPWGLTQSQVKIVYDVSRVDHAPAAVRVTPAPPV